MRQLTARVLKGSQRVPKGFPKGSKAQNTLERNRLRSSWHAKSFESTSHGLNSQLAAHRHTFTYLYIPLYGSSATIKDHIICVQM